jgi:hypothetical protein
MMTRARLVEIAEGNIKAHPEMLMGTAKAISVADQLVEMGLYSADYAYEEVYKAMTYEKARLMTNEMFRQAGMPL